MAHKTTERRRKLKLEDPEKYQLYLEESRKRNKKNRDKLKQALQKKKPDAEDVEKKEHILALQKIRQKKYLEKKQTNEKLVVKLTDCLPKNKKTKQPQPKPKTRHAIQERREYNRKKKQEERAKQSYQKKMWNRKKDRERKQRKRAELSKSPKSTETSSPSASHVEETGFTSKKTEWNTTSKVRKQLPQTPKKFAKVVTNLVENATPRKRKAIEQLKNKSKKPRLTRTVKELPRKETSKTRCARFIIKRSLKRRSRIDVLGIQKFYMREDISQVLPNKRFATKDGPGYIMQVPIRVAHAKYLNENPSNRVSIGKFASLRKKNVRKLTKTHRNYCCCVFCMNIRFKLLTLSRSVTQTSKKKVNECDLQEITLCPKGHNERFHDPACINGTCEKCNDYKKTLDEFYSSVDANKQLNWSRWEKVKGKDGKEKRIVVTKRGNKDDLLTELVENDIQNPAQGTQFFQHLFNAKWQQLQFQHAKMDIADDDVVQVMDFARNREIKYQDEIKATYYTASQVTMHPIVNFYKTETGLMRESCIVISEDCKHDFHAVHHFENIVKEHLTEEMGQPPNRYIIFSDGCSAQYKSKGPFADLSLVATDTNRNFFGSEHGKNECDGEIGVVNQAIDRAIIGNKVVINNAEEMFQFCKANLETNEVLSKRTFFSVKENEIERDRPETNVKTVPNTRKLHQINNCHLKNSLRTRNLSCFCRSCESWNYADCLNSKYVGAYEVKQLQIERKEKKRNVPDQSKTDNSNEAETTGQRQNPNIPVTEENETHILDQTNIDTPDKTETMGQRQNLNIPVPEESASDEDERSTFFASKLQLFSECNNYQELERKVFDSVNDVKHKFGEADIDTTVCIVDNKLTADAVAQSIMDSYPNDCPDDLQGRLPVVVNGDGNCLPRTASVLAFGNEQRYTEMRCRIIIELIENKETYLSIDHLNKCIDLPGNESASLLKTYCMFSEKYIPGTRTTRKAITKVFEEEVVAICVDKAYMGIWQLFAVSSVLHCKIFSVYPALSSALYQMTMNRLIPPIDDRHKESLGCVVWTSTRNDMTARNWLPNHFVPLVPIENFRPTHVEVIELFDDSDVMETSVDSALMEGIIENLCQSPEASFSEISTRYTDDSSQQTPIWTTPLTEEIPTRTPDLTTPITEEVHPRTSDQQPQPEDEDMSFEDNQDTGDEAPLDEDCGYQEDDASQQTPVWTTPLIEEMTPRTPDLTTPLKDETTPRTQNLTTTLTEEIPTRTMDQQPQPDYQDMSSEDSQDTGGEAPPDEDCGYREDDSSQQTSLWATTLTDEIRPGTPDSTTPLTEEIAPRTLDQQPQPEDEDMSSEDSQDTGGEAPPDEDCGYREDDSSQQTSLWATPLTDEIRPRTPNPTTPLTEEIAPRTQDQQPQPEDEDISSEDSQDTGGEAPPDEDCGYREDDSSQQTSLWATPLTDEIRPRTPDPTTPLTEEIAPRTPDQQTPARR